MPRFLHTADWQIGRQYTRFENEDAAILANARFEAIERIANLATQQAVDAVLVAGDVFDEQTVSDRVIHRTFQGMAAYTGPWILIPGNHDAALAESVWTRAARIGAITSRVHVLVKPGVFPVADAGFAVLAAPLTQRQTHDDLTAWFDNAESPGGLLRIGLAHGCIQGQLPEEADSPNPIAADRAETAHLDYLALGDWHGLKRIDARTWYSGTPEQERFKDNGAGQVVVVDIPAPGAEPSVEPHRVGRHVWIKRNHRIETAAGIEDLLCMLTHLPPESVVDLTLEGSLDLAGHERLKRALEEAAGRQRSLAVHQEGLRLQPTDADLAALHADGYVGEVIAELRERQQQSSGQSEIAQCALGILADLVLERRQEAKL